MFLAPIPATAKRTNPTIPTPPAMNPAVRSAAPSSLDGGETGAGDAEGRVDAGAPRNDAVAAIAIAPSRPESKFAVCSASAPSAKPDSTLSAFGGSARKLADDVMSAAANRQASGLRLDRLLVGSPFPSI